MLAEWLMHYVGTALAQYIESGKLPAEGAVVRAALDWADRQAALSLAFEATGGAAIMLRAYAQRDPRATEECPCCGGAGWCVPKADDWATVTLIVPSQCSIADGTIGP